MLHDTVKNTILMQAVYILENDRMNLREAYTDSKICTDRVRKRESHLSVQGERAVHTGVRKVHTLSAIDEVYISGNVMQLMA